MQITISKALEARLNHAATITKKTPLALSKKALEAYLEDIEDCELVTASKKGSQKTVTLAEVKRLNGL